MITLILALLALLNAASPAPASRALESDLLLGSRYGLDLDLACDETTDSVGADEVYVVVAWRTSDGREGKAVVPGEDSRFDFTTGNDSNPKHRHKINLPSVPLESGQTVSYLVLIGEDDDEVLKDAIGFLAGSVLRLLGSPDGGKLAEAVIKAIPEGDDTIGTFRATIGSDGSVSYDARWLADQLPRKGIFGALREALIPKVDADRGDGRHEFRWAPGSHNYVGWVSVRRD